MLTNLTYGGLTLQGIYWSEGSLIPRLSLKGSCVVGGEESLVHIAGADLGILIGGFFFRECISNNHLTIFFILRPYKQN